MKLGRSLAIILWFIVINLANMITDVFFGFSASSEFCLITALIVSWCTDE